MHSREGGEGGIEEEAAGEVHQRVSGDTEKAPPDGFGGGWEGFFIVEIM